MFRKILISAMLIAGSTAANASLLFSEGFDSIGSMNTAGWLAGNFSSPPGDSSWFLGNTAVFNSHEGADDSYIAADFANAAYGGNIDNWLVSPLFAAQSGSVLSFFTRTAGANPFGGDNLELLYNNVGTTNLLDFVSLGVIASAGYPTDWTAFNFTYGGADANVRFAFRYRVTDTSTYGDYIGIDSMEVTVPEPGTLLLLGAGLLLLPLARRRRIPGQDLS